MNLNMNIAEALEWRYAAKRMTGAAIPEKQVQEMLEAARLAPSGIGLQPYEILVIRDPSLKKKILPIANNQMQVVECSHLLVFAAWDNYTEERINRVFDYLAFERSHDLSATERQRNFAITYFSKFTEAENFHHAAKQAHIAFGLVVAAASLNKIDSTPMEGFNAPMLDELLDLPAKGLRSSMLLALGYRDVDNDWNHKLKKVRKPMNELVTFY